jgi:hypothetical protein
MRTRTTTWWRDHSKRRRRPGMTRIITGLFNTCRAAADA